MVFVVIHKGTVVGASTDIEEARRLAEAAATRLDDPGYATAHLLIQVWQGTTHVDTYHVYAAR